MLLNRPQLSKILGWFVGYGICYLLMQTVGDLKLHERVLSTSYPHGHLDTDEEPLPIVMNLDSDVLSHQGMDNSTAAALLKKVRVLCWIVTHPKNVQAKARHVKATWAKRCDRVLFMSSEEDKELGAIGLGTGEGRDKLYWKTIKALYYIHENHLDDADWFLKADDDTYVIMENLKLLLVSYSPSEPIFFGRKFKYFVKQGYMSGGGGYAMSREAVRKFVEAFETGKCTHASTIEDVEVAKCLAKVGVVAGESLDMHRRETFHGVFPEELLTKKHDQKPFWYRDYSYHPLELGPRCCSDYSATFHYMSPTWMYTFEYFAYHLRPYGYSHRELPINQTAQWALFGRNSDSSSSQLKSLPVDSKLR
ncbi:glycoprotein-N-acetylgalactosamine 3-beta-galactosyltransferase 1-like [Petromyzon marinus]|uniref:glycoprotein-N-acetylgalactosamine 3-beta-galactosyltransferase 1-like n=1 Tax=Petromyzon marinus TaxID=7757 RepID=UPI003F6E7D23